MSDQEFIHQLKTDIQALKIKDEYRSKELDALMSKLDESTEKLNRLSEILAGYWLHKMLVKQQIMNFVKR